MSNNNPRGAGRKPIIGGKLMKVIATPDEIVQIKELLKEIRLTAKTKKK